MTGWAALGVLVLLASGIYLLLSRHLQEIVMGTILFSNGINLSLLCSVGLPCDPAAPFLAEGPIDRLVDPLPQAFILTAIVINVGLTMYLLALSAKVHLDERDDQVD